MLIQVKNTRYYYNMSFGDEILRQTRPKKTGMEIMPVHVSFSVI